MSPSARQFSSPPQRRSFDLRGNREDATLLDKERQQRLNDLSQELLIQMHTLMRMLNFHGSENEATQKVLLKLHDALKQLFQTEYELRIEFTGSDFIINERWTRLARQLQDLNTKLGGELKSRDIGCIWISAVPHPQDLLRFIKYFLSIDPTQHKDAFSALQNLLWNQQVEWVSLEKYVEFIDWEGEGVDIRSYIRQIYFSAIQSVQQIYLQAQQNKPLKLKSAKRAIQAFVELFTSTRRREEADFLRLLTNVKNCLGYRYSRAVNTAIHAIGFCQHLGFQRNSLRDIGIAALFYDIGMSKLPPNLEHKVELTQQERAAYEAHPAMAVPIILNTTYIDSGVMRAVNVAFAHHLGFKGGGFPAYGQSVKSPVSQIISIVDKYDALITPHPEQTKIMSPPQALGELTLSSNPILIRKFVDYIGILPLGTLVRLNTGEIAYVMKQHDGDRDMLRRPVVKIILSQRGHQGRAINLAHTRADGSHPATIVDILDLGQTTPQQALLEDLLL